MTSSLFNTTLPRAEWQARRAAYLERVRPLAEDRPRRAAHGIKHPVYDFLFEYYAFRPAYLMRWSPGVGVRLEGATLADADWPAVTRECHGGIVIPLANFPDHRQKYIEWAIRYLEETSRREPVFGCFGMHEWAMVYRDPNTRHRVPLRLSREATDAVVEAGPVRCTHYDAFRFFTPAAVPLNRFTLTRETTTNHDQPGCVHANMDLYKFAFVIAPFSSSELIADAFELAVAARELDMRASPYNLQEYGFPPICIETREGREEYVSHQREIYRRGLPVRERLLSEYKKLTTDNTDGHG